MWESSHRLRLVTDTEYSALSQLVFFFVCKICYSFLISFRCCWNSDQFRFQFYSLLFSILSYLNCITYWMYYIFLVRIQFVQSYFSMKMLLIINLRIFFFKVWRCPIPSNVGDQTGCINKAIETRSYNLVCTVEKRQHACADFTKSKTSRSQMTSQDLRKQIHCSRQTGDISEVSLAFTRQYS